MRAPGIPPVGSRQRMTDPRVLLERHKPRLVYDSQEAYFADSAAVFTDSPTNSLGAPTARPIATPPKLSLDYLGRTDLQGRHAGPGGRRASATRTRNYAKNAKAMHDQARSYRDRVYGHARQGQQGPLVAPVLALLLLQRLQPGRPAGRRRRATRATGSSCRSGSAPTSSPSSPSTRSTRPPRAKPWAQRPRRGNTPLVYVARGSHANYFGAGSHFTGTWFDQADGKGPTDHADARDRRRPGARVAALARLVGGHEGGLPAAGLPQPEQPRPPRRTGSTPPSSSGAEPKARTRPARSPRRPSAHREGDHIVVDYEADPEASTLVVATRPKGSDEPADGARLPARRGQGRGRDPRARPRLRRLDERRRPRPGRLGGHPAG